MTTKIELRRMTFYAYHGVAPQETRVGNTFIVDLILTAPLENAVWSDDLSDTINYATVLMCHNTQAMVALAAVSTSRARGGAYLEGFEREISTDHGGGTCLV